MRAKPKPAVTVTAKAAHGHKPNAHRERAAQSREPAATINLLPYPNTDVGNAERLVAMFGNDFRYCLDMKKWLVWNGSRWRIDRDGEMNRKAKQTVRMLYLQAASIDDSKKRESVESHARGSESAKGIRAMLDCAKTENGVPVAAVELDSNPWLLNCPNGTLDLQLDRWSFRESRREDLITKVCSVELDPAPCPHFERFLERIFDGSPALIDYVQRVFGYALTGVVTEKAMFCLFGKGNNGKTTLLELFRYILGDYGGQVMIDSLLRQRGNASSTTLSDLSDLRGARFVTTSETEEGARLAEATVKQLTGMGQIKSCRKYENPISFPATHKLFMDANHRPLVSSTDKALWNRLKPIPFIVEIPDCDQDKRLLDKMKQEGPAILWWAVLGCYEWQQQNALGEPPEVTGATEVWREESDPLRDFLRERCDFRPDSYCRASELKEAFEQWSESEGSRLTVDRLWNRLKEQGCERDRMKIHGTQSRVWRGVELRAG